MNVIYLTHESKKIEKTSKHIWPDYGNLQPHASLVHYKMVMLRDRIVIGVHGRQSGYRARLSRESVLTLEKAQMMCRSAEQANLQIQNMESKEQITHFARSNKIII